MIDNALHAGFPPNYERTKRTAVMENALFPPIRSAGVVYFVCVSRSINVCMPGVIFLRPSRFVR